MDVTDPNFRCYSSGRIAPNTYTVEAGSNITFNSNNQLYHIGVNWTLSTGTLIICPNRCSTFTWPKHPAKLLTLMARATFGSRSTKSPPIPIRLECSTRPFPRQVTTTSTIGAFQGKVSYLALDRATFTIPKNTPTGECVLTIRANPSTNMSSNQIPPTSRTPGLSRLRWWHTILSFLCTNPCH